MQTNAVKNLKTRRAALLVFVFATSFLSARAFAQVAPANPGFTFVQKHCLSCHDTRTKEGELDLSQFAEQSAVLASRKLWSKALQHVRNREMPPLEADQPTQEEREAFVSTMQDFFRKVDAQQPGDPGRVTVRRLNRTEYNNTIRDLCMSEYKPAESFPPDELHDGFDNNGVSLTLPPVLMEQYLNAAEAVIARTLVTGEPSEPKVRVGFKQFMTQGTNIPHWVYLLTSEPLTAEFPLAADGKYLLRLQGQPIGAKAKTAKVRLFVDGEEVCQVEFAGADNDTKLPLTLTKGVRIVSVSLLNPSPDLEAKKAYYPPRFELSKLEPSYGLRLHRLDLVGPTEERPEGHRRIMACDPQAEPLVQAREILSRFASRAFRRPATDEEVERYVRLFQRSSETGKDFETAIGIALQAILVSPNFLFRVELDDRQQSKEPHPISEYHLASRLSYFLWSSMPDEELLELAAKGELSKNLDAQVRRMLDDWKSEAFGVNFAPLWLAITDIDRVTRGGEEFDLRMRADMTRETVMFFDTVVRENRPITDLLDGRYTFVNDQLAKLYEIGKYGGEETEREFSPFAFTKIALPDDGIRAGILTHGSVLAMTSAPDRTSPVKRGVWILENILGSPPPPPPADVPALEEVAAEKPQQRLSLRETLEIHRRSAECAACHAKIDPLGFAFEKFDNIGRYHGKSGDDLVELPDGRKLQGVPGLRQLLLERKGDFARCLAEKVLAYALGRSIEDHDVPTIDAIAAKLAEDEYRFQRLIHEVVKSAPFRMRRGSSGEFE